MKDQFGIRSGKETKEASFALWMTLEQIAEQNSFYWSRDAIRHGKLGVAFGLH